MLPRVNITIIATFSDFPNSSLFLINYMYLPVYFTSDLIMWV